MVVFGQSDCIRAKVVLFGKMVVFGKKWLYSGKSGCIRQKVDLVFQSGCIWAKIVKFGQNG